MESERIDDLLIKFLPSAISALMIIILCYFVYRHKRFGIGVEDLMYIEVLFFSIIFLLIIVLLILNLGEFRRNFMISRRTWILLFMILILGFSLREFIVPHTHRIFFDEDLYLGIANSIATEGKNILCNYGTPTHCREGILNKDPSGWPFLLAIFYTILGTSEEIAFKISAIIGTLSILLIFLIAFLLFRSHEDRRETIALFSALLFALTPAHIIWSGSVATEVPFCFFSLLTILSYLLYLRNEKFRTHLLGIALLAFTVQIRPEGILFILIIIFMLILFERELLSKLTDSEFLIPWVLLFFLITPHLIHLYSHMGMDWGAPSGKKFSLEYAPHNFSFNAMFWFTGEMHPLFFTLLSIIGIANLFSRDRRICIFLILWFITYFILFGLFYAGGVDNGGIGFRFINIYFSPVILFGGYGAFSLGRSLERLYKNLNLRGYNLFAYSTILLLILLSFTFFSDFPYKEFGDIIKFILPNSMISRELTQSLIYPPVEPYTLEINDINLTLSKSIGFIMVPNRQAQYAREMHDILVLRNIDEIDGSCYVLTHNPSIFLIHGKNSLQTWFGSNKRVMDEIFNETDCVLWLEGAWCLFEPHKSGVCRNMHNRYELEIMDRHVMEDNPEQVFTIYKVRRKEG
ncbi:MAG: hypothetical protein DRO90_00830 [Candidatus Altiarchaeales archaeon]|nr:MAG: hypothetical protein DRO90_00830 [Candidatus Altiarchaeales archaeon]